MPAHWGARGHCFAVRQFAWSAVVLPERAGVAIDDKSLHQGIVLGHDIGGDGVGILLLDVADFEPLIAAPGEPALDPSLHVIGGEIEVALGIGSTVVAVAGSAAVTPAAH